MTSLDTSAETEYKVTIERMTDAARFVRAIRASDESALLRLVHKMLLPEPQDYYVVSIEKVAA